MGAFRAADMSEGVEGLPRWIRVGRRARWWSQSQKKRMGVVITSLDEAKRQVVATFESDKKVWKSVPFSKLSAKDCPLTAYPSDEKAAEGSPTASSRDKEKDKDKEKEEEARSGSRTPDWWTLEKTRIKTETQRLQTAT